MKKGKKKRRTFKCKEQQRKRKKKYNNHKFPQEKWVTVINLYTYFC